MHVFQPIKLFHFMFYQLCINNVKQNKYNRCDMYKDCQQIPTFVIYVLCMTKYSQLRLLK